jgi:hypothetical protein
LPNPEDIISPSPTPGAAENSTDTEFSQTSQASLWDEKPWWCQPWTIVLTGLIAIAGSWWLLHLIWITGLVFAAIAAWWLLFLVLVPRAYRENQL